MTAFSLLTKDTTAFKLCPECGGFLCRQRKCSQRGPPGCGVVGVVCHGMVHNLYGTRAGHIRVAVAGVLAFC